MVVKFVILDKQSNDIPITFEHSRGEFYRGNFRDFRGEDLGWYFNDWSKHYHPMGIRGGTDFVVDSATLMYAGELIMDEIAENLQLTLSDDPLEAKRELDRIKTSDMAVLRSVIDELEFFAESGQPERAWEFLKGAPQKFTHGIPHRVIDLSKYIDIGAFFYIVGLCGHGGKWIYE